MAEVLITLGIIGVVAAITLPTLIQNYQKQVWVNQLKKVINSIENNNRKLLADEGVDSLDDTQLGKFYNNKNQSDVEAQKDELYNYYEKHFLWRKLGENTDIYKAYDFISLYSSDGSCILPHVNDGNMYMIDVNCDKAPNKVGRDRFALIFNKNGLYSAHWENGIEPTCEEFTEFSGTDEGTVNLYWLFAGFACTNKIIRDGWKMDY